MNKIIRPWAWEVDLRHRHDIHLWTIQIEFAHSMFLVLLMLSRVRRLARPVALDDILAYCLGYGRCAVFKPLAGMLLADINVS